ncbi:SUKH-4 family immunity protein [Streptomyces kutzneri]|uniref:SUKH-4 family immunity protein n=1 Tax=Streptomyces kutzneri TaxID=3051179 RepID=UPI0028D69680|nr:SUKH-4 family immunity protein [Streptomyces sp. DSM 40907]
MSEDQDSRCPFDDPAAVLRADRAALRGGAVGEGGIGREVFTQAEAVFGRAGVGREEFASWLHFAATVLGHHAYAARVAEAEPALPWRTVWAWWRPVGAYVAEPNLSGDHTAEVYDLDEGAAVKVWALWCEDAWFDLETGRRLPAPADGAPVERKTEEPDGPWLFDAEDEGWALHCPGTWEEPVVLGGGRYLYAEARGVVVVEENAAALAGRPRGGADTSSWECAEDTPWFRPGTRGSGPLSAAGLARTFGDARVTRIPRDELPDALEHPATREFLDGVGLPRHWAAGVSSFDAAPELLRPLTASAPGAGDEDLLHLGTFDFGYTDPGLVGVHRVSGAVYMYQESVIPLARDVASFVGLLDGIRRYMGACWSPYPAEDGIGAFREAMWALDSAALAHGSPSAETWEHLFAAITELGVYGY